MTTTQFITTCGNNFDECISLVKEEIKKDDGSFDEAIAKLKQSRMYIDALQHIVNQMKQEEHDLTQDVYNKFKDKGFVKTIKF